MKFNKWTYGLAALGVVSLASAAKADEKMTALQAALSSTTISGYVDTSAQWNLGTGNQNLPPYSFGGSSKADGFNLNVVQVSIAKALDEAEWASGYKVDLWFGPDANILGSQSINSSASGDLAIRQAYVALRTPLGNGIDWKIGVFDTVIGYESLESGNNPHYTRSYGFSIEPTTHTGILGTYRINDMFSVSAGIANTVGPTINDRAHGPNSNGGNGPNGSVPFKAESYKAYMGSIAFTAPSDWGWASGSTLYAGIVNGFSSFMGDNQTSYYVGGTLATPVTGLKVGAAFDYLDVHNFASDRNNIWTAALYASYQATEKLSVAGRGEYLDGELPGDNLGIYAFTATLQYDLWQNVISRLEFRWDHVDSAPGGNRRIFGGIGSTGNSGGSDIETDDETPGFPPVKTGGVEPDDEGGSSAIGDALFGSFNPTIQNRAGARENAFLVAVQLIYKF